MDIPPKTRKESKKSAKEKHNGKNQLGSAKGTRAKEANLERGFKSNESKKN
jgi:ribosome assembly protein YihI (activator of Der GTPase)